MYENIIVLNVAKGISMDKYLQGIDKLYYKMCEV